MASTNEEGAARISQLEARYVELLEKRVADLEAVVTKKDKTKSKQPGQDITSNERVEKYLSNGGKNQRRESVSSHAVQSVKPSKIRFRDMKYNQEGVETPVAVSDKEATKIEDPVRPKDSVDLIWTRRFDLKGLYKSSEVQVVSKELLDLFRLEFAHDPRLHFGTDNNKNDVTITSPFEPILHRWRRLQSLVRSDCAGEEWQKLKKEMTRLRTSRSTATALPGPNSDDCDDMIMKAKEGLIALLSQVQLSPGVDTFLKTIEASGENKSIQFKKLWTLFPPGEIVYSEAFLKLPQLFIVKECSSDFATESDSGSQREKKVWFLWCWSYDWNGTTFNRVPVYFKFDEYQGSRMINTLQCHPLRYHFMEENSEEKIDKLKKKLIKSGKLYRDYCTRSVGAQMFNYKGTAVSHGSGFQRMKNNQNQNKDSSENILYYLLGRRRGRSAPIKQGERREITGRVMVDFDSYIQHAPNDGGAPPPMGNVLFSARDDECRCGTCTQNAALIKNQWRNFDGFGSDRAFVDEQYLICPPRVLGYHLDTRTWLELDVEKVENISQPTSNEAFVKLQLPKANKDLIQNLVQSHTSGTGKKAMMEDIVSGKGKGLVILLHGPPGVGKTLTAESVAAMAGKPLFAVSPSDIGLDPADVEHNLESLFELAARWRAVLLFDEADVFLESRSSHTSDLTRNALVSVLLRVLEYYSGILILTTNRINQFDIAVQSRVNLGIKYTDLTFDQKKKIFQQFIKEVKDDQIEDRQRILDWFCEDSEASDWFESLNGRQVRNVLFSAASLALKDGECLKLEHIETMAKSTAKFQESLRVVVQNARIKSEAGRYGD